MVHDEQLAIRDREMSRYEKGLASPKSGRDLDESAYEQAISMRDYAFSHIATTMKFIEKQHPEFAEERAVSQVQEEEGDNGISPIPTPLPQNPKGLKEEKSYGSAVRIVLQNEFTVR
ncbi:hypothetical protein [Lacrimispora sp. 38-1]|uniref:hypothetical protein n=1 Tax=Lacrimispora sp. 38-1 TaxID=3125778 RepID=UPI003CE9F2F8